MADIRDQVRPSAEIDQKLLREGIEAANIPTLLMCLVQMTGDRKWLSAPYAPSRVRGIEVNDSAGLADAIQKEVRDAAHIAIADWINGTAISAPRPANAELASMLAFSMREDVPEEYGEIIAAGMKLDAAAPRLKCPSARRAIIIGGGISGVAAAVEMHQMGIEYLLLEKNADLGGTWWENRYPGCGVDTPNLTYTFSFAPTDWSKHFPLRGEIDQYIRSTAKEHEVYDSTQFNVMVNRAEWIDEDQHWKVIATSADGTIHTYTADIIFSAVGILNTPKTPVIPGLEEFPGPVIHTSRWPEGVEVEGKRVAVVGNGASGMQVVPAIADDVDQLTVFARSKQWAAPHPQFLQDVPEGVRYLMQTVPLYRAWYEQRLAWLFNDRLYGTLFRDPDWSEPERSINSINDRHREHYTAYIKSELGDRQDLLPDLLPDYPPYLKRMLLDNGWFRTMTKPNVRLIPERLARVEGSTLFSSSGVSTEVDMIILATGYAASEMLASYEVVGRGGRVLKEFWDGDDVAAYLGTLVPGFPNFFILVGPHTGSGHGGSMMRTMENQVHYAAKILEELIRRGASSVDVREEVYDAYRVEVDAMHEKLMWSHAGTDNWYRNARGRVTAITPWRNDKFWRMTRSPQEDDLEFFEHRSPDKLRTVHQKV